MQLGAWENAVLQLKNLKKNPWVLQQFMAKKSRWIFFKTAQYS